MTSLPAARQARPVAPPRTRISRPIRIAVNDEFGALVAGATRPGRAGAEIWRTACRRDVSFARGPGWIKRFLQARPRAVSDVEAAMARRIAAEAPRFEVKGKARRGRRRRRGGGGERTRGRARPGSKGWGHATPRCRRDRSSRGFARLAENAVSEAFETTEGTFLHHLAPGRAGSSRSGPTRRITAPRRACARSSGCRRRSPTCGETLSVLNSEWAYNL